MRNERWFKGQGFNLSECAPTVASNIVNLMGGNTDRFKARAFNRRGSNWLRWWNLYDIANYLDREMIPSVIAPYRRPQRNELSVYHINGRHFVMIINNNGKLDLYNTLFRGSIVRNINWNNFKQKITYRNAITVKLN